MGEVILITSGKGGVGKTTITANIGTALAVLGKNVVLIDGDTELRNLDIVLGLQNKAVYKSIDVLKSKSGLSKSLIKDKRSNRLFLLPAIQSHNNHDIEPLKMLEVVNYLKVFFDYVLIDCPSGIKQGFESSVIGADRALVVVNPDITSIINTSRVIDMLKDRNIKDIKLIINRIDHEMARNGDIFDVEDIVRSLNLDLIGVIIDDKTITLSTNRGEPITLNKSSKLRMAFIRIAMRIIGKNVPLIYDMKIEKTFRSPLKKLFAIR